MDEARVLIADELAAMENLLRQTLANTDPFIDEVVRHALKISGKRLRPMLLFLTGRAVCGGGG